MGVRPHERGAAMTALTALATAAIVRPDGGAAPPGLAPVVRTACAGVWRALEVVLAGDRLRAQLATSAPTIRAGAEAILGMIGAEVPPRLDALAELRQVRASGALDHDLDLTAIVSSCGRNGDAPAVVAGRRRVRTHAMESLRRTFADRQVLANALADSALVAVLVDAARVLYRHAARSDPELARWASPPTGTTTRDHALTAFAELALAEDAVGELEALLASVLPAMAPVTAPTVAPTPAPAVAPTPAPAIAPTPAPAVAPAVAPTPAPTVAATSAPVVAPVAAPKSPAPTVASTPAPAIAPKSATTVAPSRTHARTSRSIAIAIAIAIALAAAVSIYLAR